VTDPASRRIPHILPRTELAVLLAPTYATALSVDEEEARERLEQALQQPELLRDLHAALAAAVVQEKGPRTTEDGVVDKLSAGLQARRARVRAAPAGPGLSALLVRINLELGLAPEPMRATLASDKGRALLAAGLRELAGHLVKELLR
jgi:hypothetical protein